MRQPPVSVVTPVYNGAAYLAACIESVLGQEYRSFEYVIADNCSTDGSLDIARDYARRDRRVRVERHTEFVGAIENHNRALAAIARDSKYCKVVSADDVLTADALGKMVAVAETNPTVGIVGCLQQSGDRVKWRGVPEHVPVLRGRDAARLGLLHGVHVLGTPTSVLYRTDLFVPGRPFYPHARSHADASACYESFDRWDFGFIHEPLAVERVHAGQWSARMDALEAGSAAYLELLLQYGPRFLEPAEFDARKAVVFGAYYRALGGYALKLRGPAFWRFHAARMREIGDRLDWPAIARAALAEALVEARHPAVALRKVATAIASLDWRRIEEVH